MEKLTIVKQRNTLSHQAHNEPPLGGRDCTEGAILVIPPLLGVLRVTGHAAN
jgi:hypothetical protein